MSDVHRGGIYRHPSGRRFLVVSVNALNASGTAIVVEVAPEQMSGLRAMLTVPVGETEAGPGGWVLSWRLNYMSAERLGDFETDVRPDTMARVITSINAAIEP